MTEAEWLSLEDPISMLRILKFLKGRVSDRKLKPIAEIFASLQWVPPPPLTFEIQYDPPFFHIQGLRDIFGNPFRPVSFDPEWRTSTVVALAQQMYDSRDFSTMPILADALQDAGCDNADVLSHCRGDGPHVRGCWVVDMILCKS